MTTDAVMIRLNNILRRVFSNPILTITRSTTAGDVPGWDSLSNLFLSMEIEAEFGCDITGDDIGRLGDIGELVDLLLAKLRHTDDQGQS